MLLTIDAGNTRTKWAVFNTAGISMQAGASLNSEIADVDLSPANLSYQSIVISNVAGAAHADLLNLKLAGYQLPIYWVKSSAAACGLHSSYSKPEDLGTDRWAALIAAYHLKQADCIVVNAGTAVTIDALQINSVSNTEATFIGGMILPGLHLMQLSLGQATAQLPRPDALTAPQVTNTTATSTTAAIYAGALYAIVGAISMMLQSFQPAKPRIVISGGDAQVIYDALIAKLEASKLENGVLIVDNLVLQGLFLIGQAEKNHE